MSYKISWGPEERAKKEIEDTGEISPELRQQLSAKEPHLFEAIWSAVELHTQEKLKTPEVSAILCEADPQQHPSILAWVNASTGIGLLKELAELRCRNMMETAVGQHGIPTGEALDKVLRYGAAVERDLGRALDRLERLQRRRLGEALPPPLSIKLQQ